jgi:hypothetical protein
LLYELIESHRTGKPFSFDNVADFSQENVSTNLHRDASMPIFGDASGLNTADSRRSSVAKDYGKKNLQPLMADFDRRIEFLEKKQ